MKKVTIFTSSTWPHCHSALEFLKENNIEFEERNIQLDPEARNELIKHRIMGVPAFFVDEDIVVGFDKGKLKSLLDL